MEDFYAPGSNDREFVDFCPVCLSLSTWPCYYICTCYCKTPFIRETIEKQKKVLDVRIMEEKRTIPESLRDMFRMVASQK